MKGRGLLFRSTSLAVLVAALAAAGWLSAAASEPATRTAVDRLYVYLPYVVGVREPEPDVRISELQYQGTDEWLELVNQGTAEQDMTGWVIHSVVGDQWFAFEAGYTLAPRATVQVHSGPDAAADPPADLLWETKHTWNNEGDKAVLYDAEGRQVDTSCYLLGCP
jgi:hypothetical protein